MTDEELLALIDGYAGTAYGQSGQLEEDRSESVDRYNCQPYGDEVAGQSGAVATDLRDTVEWMMPKLLRIFIGGDEVGKFDPKGPEDEAAAQQETDYINHVILEKNNGFLLFSSWFRDALLQKNGYAKVWWEKKSDVMMETYQGLPDEALAMLLQDDDIEPVAHTAYPNPSPQLGGPPGALQMGQPPQPPPMLHDVRVRRTKPYEYCKVECVPPEEMRVIKSARDVSVQNLSYIEHRTRKTLSELRQMGYETSDDMLGDTPVNDQVSQSRNLYDEFSDVDNSSDKSMRFALYREVYLRADVDGDGVAELRKVCIAGKVILHNEETDLIPFAAITPIISPHRHIGVSYYDLVKEISRIKTILLRGALNSLYLMNNGRYGVDVTKVNVDDMLTSRPGGIVRVNGGPGESIFPFQHPQALPMALEGISYVDKWRENATGINAYYQGMGDDVLNKTATGTNAMMTASEARVEAVARTFAETGVRDLMLLVHAMTLKNATQEDKVRLRNQWVAVDPREWVRRDNLTISVGLGGGSKAEKIQGLNMLLQMQMQVLMPQGLCSRDQIKNTAEELIKEMGYKVSEKFVMEGPPPQPQPPPQVMIAQMNAQNDMQLADKKMQNEAALAQQDAGLKMQIAQMEAEIEAKTKIAVANIEIAAKERIEAMRLMHLPTMTDGRNLGAM